MAKLKDLKIFGKTVKVKMDDLSQYNLAGQYSYETDEITIDNKCPDKFQCLGHEMVHAVWHRLGMNQTTISLDIQEMLAEGIATALYENFGELKHAEKYFAKKITKNRKK